MRAAGIRYVFGITMPLLIATLLVITSTGVSQPIDFNFPNFNTTNGMITNVVHHSMQDSRGYLWFATDSGVSRFDGNRFRHFTTNDGLGGNEIFFIYEDSRNRIWFLSFNGVPSYYYESSFRNPSNNAMLAQLIFNNMHVAVFEDHDGAIWLYSLDGTIYRIDIDATVTRVTADGLSNMLRQGWVDAKNRVYAGTSLGTYMYDAATQSWIKAGDKRFRVIQHQHTRQGSFLIPTIDGIIYSGSPDPYFIDNNTLGITSEVSFVTRGEQQIYLAVGTMGNGVKFYVYNGADTSEQITTILDGQTITSLTFDDQESLWVTTLRDGVFRIDRAYSNLRNVASPDFESSFSIRSSFTTSDGFIWYGTDTGNLVAYDSNGKPIDIQWLPSLPNFASIEDLFELNDGRFAIVSSNQVVLTERNSNTLRVVHTFLYSAKRFVQRNDDFFIGTTTALFRVNSDLIESPEEILQKRITELRICDGKLLWAGTINGLHIFDENLEELPVHPIFDQEQIIAIEPLYDRLVAVGTHGSGVIIYNVSENSVVSHITTDDGLADDMIKALRFDTKQLWVSTSFGISLISLNPDTDIRFQIERLPQGLSTYSGRLFGTQIYHIELRDEEIWLGGDNTLLAMHRSEAGITPSIIPLLIDQITVNDKVYSTNFPGEVDYNENQWTFGFTGILMRDGDRLMYRYRLNSSKSPAEDWSITQNNAVAYRSIPPGTYTFEVEAFTKDGNIFSRRVSVPFTILRPWWMLPWVWVGALAVTFAIIIAAFNLRVRQIQEKENQKLQFQKQINELEYQALQAMMSPHFVFNILNNIRYQIIKDDKNQASKLLVDFSKLIRRQLDSAYQRSTSLTEELDRLKLYIELESTRLQHPIEFIYELTADVDPITTHIPSMLLQPFIENAVIHGISPMDSGGKITLNISRSENGQLYIDITDNGTGIKVEKRPTVEGDRLSLGTELVKQRLNILAKGNNLDWNVTVENIVTGDGPPTGVRATLLLPIR